MNMVDEKNASIFTFGHLQQIAVAKSAIEKVNAGHPCLK